MTSEESYPPAAAADRARHPLALSDPDPMVRLAAVHHIGRRLAGASLAAADADRRRLDALLPHRTTGGKWVTPPDYDEFVARYAAVTMARAGDAAGLELLLHRVAERGDAPLDPELDECLRNCGTFPFAALLNEYVHLGASRAAREVVGVLDTARRLTADGFRDRAAREPGFRHRFLDDLGRLGTAAGVSVRAGRVFDRGWVLSPPAGKQPGYVCCPSRGWFLLFNEESVLNARRHLPPGREVVFVAAAGDPSGAAVCVYGLDDTDPVPEKLPDWLADALAEGRGAGSPLAPGVVTRLIRRPGAEPRVEVLFADGTDQTVPLTGQDARKVEYSTLVLTPPAVAGEPDPLPLFVRAVKLEVRRAGRVVAEYARKRGLEFGRVEQIEDSADGPRAVATSPRRVPIRFPAPLVGPPNNRRPSPGRGQWLLLQPCAACKGTAAATCATCHGTAKMPCTGTAKCVNCTFTGRLKTGTICPLCRGKGERVGCGETGELACAACDGAGTQPCPPCAATGLAKCVFCKETGYTVPPGPCTWCAAKGYRHEYPDCRACGSTGVCGKCRGDGTVGGGRFPCDLCQKSTKCPHCAGTGKRREWCEACGRTGRATPVVCPKCAGKKKYPCPRCDGRKAVECAGCKGKKRVRCPACDGTKQRTCLACNGRKETRCAACAAGGWLLFKTVETFLELPYAPPPPAPPRKAPLSSFADLAAFFQTERPPPPS